MKREEVIQEIIGDDAVTEAVIALSAAYRELDMQLSIPMYLRLCAALSDVVTRLKLALNCPEEFKGTVEAYIPYVTIGMIGFAEGLGSHWTEAMFEKEGICVEDREGFLRDKAKLGDEGHPNYYHGILIAETIGEALKDLSSAISVIQLIDKVDQLNLDDSVENPFDIQAGTLH